MTTTRRLSIVALPYGTSISLQYAEAVADAALAEARRNDWTMAVAVVDTSGALVCLKKMDDTQLGSVVVCQEKATSAARFKRATKELQDGLAAGGEGLRILAIPGAVPVEGGLPIVVDGRIIGAVGLSGGTSAQDGLCAKAGLAALEG
jgi:uncharacterized protein GlcG (DUF336 family)